MQIILANLKNKYVICVEQIDPTGGRRPSPSLVFQLTGDGEPFVLIVISVLFYIIATFEILFSVTKFRKRTTEHTMLTKKPKIKTIFIRTKCGG